MAERMTWPIDAMPPGTRVRVIRDVGWNGPWAREFLGTVDPSVAPDRLVNENAQPGERAYLIAFDEPQLDASGDGPFAKALIWARYLERIGSM